MDFPSCATILDISRVTALQIAEGGEKLLNKQLILDKANKLESIREYSCRELKPK